MEDRVGNARLTRNMALTKTARLLQELAICKKEAGKVLSVVLHSIFNADSEFSSIVPFSAVVALSGGPDSVALLYVAKQLFENVRAVTVDHK